MGRGAGGAARGRGQYGPARGTFKNKSALRQRAACAAMWGRSGRKLDRDIARPNTGATMFAPAAAALALLLLAPAGTQARSTGKAVPAQGRVASARPLS